MSRSSGKAGRTGRSIAPDEADLWSRVAQSVDKVKGKSRVPSHTDTPAAPPASSQRDAPARTQNRPPSERGASPPAKEGRALPLAGFDRRAVRSVVSGKISIDARLDLHGLRQRDAHMQLRAFLFAAQSRGHKTVLIITGKGDDGADRDHLAAAVGKQQRGVLRRSIPQWLEQPDLRTVVLSYTAAATRHGGDGALYVQLRKPGRA